MPSTPFAATAAVLVVCLMATGCTGDTDASGSRPDAAASTSAAASSPASRPTQEPTQQPSQQPSQQPKQEARSAPPSPPTAADTRAGRVAFARHVVDSWGYALDTNDPRPLLALSPPRQPCGGCRALEKELRRRAAERWSVEFTGADITSTKVSSSRDGAVVTMAVAIPESDAYNDDGTYRSTSPAHPRASFQVRMRLARRGYQLVAFTVSG